jgi:hypothetical protein
MIKYFIGASLFFAAIIFVFAFTIFLYICLLIAVKNNRNVPKWMYRIGHTLTGREGDIYKDFTDKSVLNEVNAYILGVVTASIAVYFIFYDRYSSDKKLIFFLFAEFMIVIVMRIVVDIGKVLLSFIFPAIGKARHANDSSAASNAVMGMVLMSTFTCILTIMITGLPVKAPAVQVGEYKIVVGKTSAKDLLTNGFYITGRTADDIVENKRDSHFYFGETVELVKDGKVYGYINLTPKYEDKAKLEDCIVTYWGLSSKSESFDDIKICDKDISNLSFDDFEKMNIKDIFSLSPISYRENKGREYFSLIMQTYPYMLWKRYTIEAKFFGEEKSNQFEVYAQHTIWE